MEFEINIQIIHRKAEKKPREMNNRGHTENKKKWMIYLNISIIILSIMV